RVMAGARGDTRARGFCQGFFAELVSIPGVFRVFETIPAELAGKPVQAWLDGDAQRFARLDQEPIFENGDPVLTEMIVVTSAKGGGGKTPTAASIACGLATRGKKVAVIDFDIGLRNLDLIM